jgi:hypothetical protein
VKTDKLLASIQLGKDGRNPLTCGLTENAMAALWRGRARMPQPLQVSAVHAQPCTCSALALGQAGHGLEAWAQPQSTGHPQISATACFVQLTYDAVPRCCRPLPPMHSCYMRCCALLGARVCGGL